MRIITLSREYGAGGHSVGKRVAAELGIEFYDRDIIRHSAQALGIDPEQLEEEEETVSFASTFLRSISPISYDQKDAIFAAESDTILKLAEQGPCLILGRCADTVLRDAGIPCLNVFLFADEAWRMERAGKLIGSDDQGLIRRTMRRNDQARHNYYTRFTGKAWGEMQNYHLSLDSGALGYDLCVKLICAAAREME